MPSFLIYQHPFIAKVVHKRQCNSTKYFKNKAAKYFSTKGTHKGSLTKERTTELPLNT